MKLTVELDLADPRADVRYLRAHASQIPHTWKERADWFLALADQIEAQIPDDGPIRLTPREIAEITEASKRHAHKVQLTWQPGGHADLVNAPAWALRWLEDRRTNG